MKKHIFSFIVTFCCAGYIQTAFAQRYPITVGAYPANDTIPKAVFRAQAGIAEGIDDYGFETRLRGKNIVSYSCTLKKGDSVLFSVKKIMGFLFPVALLRQVKKNDGLLAVRFYDIALKTDSLPQQAANRDLRYYLE